MILAVLSCVEETPFLQPQDDDANNEPSELKETFAHYEEDYGLELKTAFSIEEFSTINSGEVLHYTPTSDVEGITKLLSYMEDSVLSYFPKEFLQEYMPRTSLLVDSLNVLFTYNDTYSDPKVQWSEHRPITGYVTDQYVVLGNASSRFNPTAAELKAELISLIVERLFGNKDRLPSIADFVKVTEEAVTASGAVFYTEYGSYMGMNYPYLDGPGTSYSTSWYATSDIFTPWLGRGVLKSGRLGHVDFSDETMFGYRLTSHGFNKGTTTKDFADFTAFILTTTAAEKEAFYNNVAANDSLTQIPDSTAAKYATSNPIRLVVRDGKYYDGAFPNTGGPIGAKAIRDKVAIVKAWWQQLGLPLKEPED
jgi:hypothetical protein